jgi:hypothetical protein
MFLSKKFRKEKIIEVTPNFSFEFLSLINQLHLQLRQLDTPAEQSSNFIQTGKQSIFAEVAIH